MAAPALLVSSAIVAIVASSAGCELEVRRAPREVTDEDRAALGARIFSDTSLSTPPGQSCATCHDPKRAFTDPRATLPVSEGAVQGRFGNRNTPSITYTAYADELRWNAEDETYEGGLFWDGRADTLEEQALLPMLSPLEMNNASEAEIATKLRAAPYYSELVRVFGPGLDSDDALLSAMTTALADFERSATVNPFSSKYDAWLRGEAELTEQEERGRRLFEDPAKGNCAACHVTTTDGMRPPLFTDYTFDNIGIPRNPSSPFFAMDPSLNPAGAQFVDEGLAETVGDPEQRGLFRVPSLRNVAITAPYGHNGFFETLRDAVRFYDSRDVDPTWPEPEILETMNTEELGDLGLSESEIDDIVVFLGTLTDGYDDPQ